MKNSSFTSSVAGRIANVFLIASMVAVSFAPLVTPLTVHASTSLISESFGTSNSASVTGWNEHEAASITGTTTDAVFGDRTQDGTLTNKFAKIGENGWICREVDATGFTNLVLSYKWKGDAASNPGEHGEVEYNNHSQDTCSSSNGSHWHNVGSDDNLSSSTPRWNSKSNVTLSGADNSVFRLRFRTNVNDGDEFYRVDDINITGTPANHAPAAQSGSISTNEDTATSSVLVATDVDSNPLTYSIVANPTHGSISGFVASTGVFTYTPAADYNGADSFTYKANDGLADSAPATVSITVNAVNDVPSFTKGADQTVTEDAGAQTIASWAAPISKGPPNESSQTLSFTVTNDNNTLFSVQPAVAADGTLTFTPAANQNGSATVTVVLHDNGGTANGGVDTSASQTFLITVSPVNDAPVANNDSYSTNEETPLSISTPGVLFNDTDIDTSLSSLATALVSGVSNGTLTLNPDGSFDYTPSTNFVGTDSFTYKANDGSADSNTATVNILVSNINDAPVATADSYSVNEDTTLNQGAPGVLGNDTDADSNPLTAVLDTTTTHGTLTLNANGSFDYTPNADYNGSDSFTYHANDGSADSGVVTATITVNPTNDAPVATGQSVSTSQNVAVTGTLAATDIDGNTLSFATTSNPAHGTLTSFNSANGSFTYMPSSGYVGSDSFDFTANDGTADSNTATVSITVSESPENTLELCRDGEDNNHNELTDLADPDCAAYIPKLTVTKVVVNDNSGTKIVSDFPLFIDGVSTVSGAATTSTVGSHTVTETSDSNYTGTFSGACDAQGNVVLAIGDDKVCTITNDDIAPTPSTPPPSTPSGGGGGGGGGGVISGPLSIGFSTPSGAVLGAAVGPEDCTKYLTAYIRTGRKNDSAQVIRLQQFLNNFENNSLKVNGIYDTSSLAAVNAFQTKYKSDILTPWGASAPTGYVYYTTQKKMNEIYCKFTKEFPLTSDQLKEIAHIKALNQSYTPSVLGTSTQPVKPQQKKK